MNSSRLNSSVLHTLLSINKELMEEKGKPLDEYIGIYIYGEAGLPYECTPEDAIVFAHTGTGGDHFAFNTNSGLITDLDEAPVLFIQPMMFSNPVKRVSHNIRDLLSIFLTLREFYILERMDGYKTREDMKLDIEKHYKQGIESRKEELDFITDLLGTRLGITPMDDVFEYMKRIRTMDVY